MKFYFNKFIQYLQEQGIEISIPYFLLLQKIKELIESLDIDIGRGKMSDKLKNFFNNQNIDYYTNDTIIVNLDSLLCEDLIDNNQNLSVNRINSLQIKNFRGFSQTGDEDNGCRFNFTDKEKIIIYGPNGSGKSSFSEALEYILTGDIKECKRKNKSLTAYCKNNQNLGTSQIILNDDIGLLISGREKEIFKRCIIEKNRITEFSLFHSKDTGLDSHEDALTFLLGFEELDNFISSFVKAENFFLQTKDNAQKDLELYQALQQNERTIFESKTKEFFDLQTFLVESNVLLYNEELKVCQHNIEILKKLDQSISTLEKDLQIPTILSKIHKHTAKDFEELVKEREEKEKKLGECIKQITEKRSEINLKKLYEAISLVPEEEVCPACYTHKNQWIRNPFETAKIELGAMEKIIQLEQTQKNLEQEIMTIIDTYNKLDQEKAINQLQLAIIIDDLQEEDYFSTIDKLSSDPINIEEKQRNLVFQKTKRDNIISKINQYNDLEKIISKGLQIGDPIIESQKQEVLRLENILNTHLQNMETSYRNFRNNIDAFYRGFIENETHGMWNDVCEYYKKINEHDEETEQVIQIEPIVDGSFNIKLVGVQGEITNDAVSYLSEGHLKALGLAVLWANMKKNDVPFMIFDDVVNAIDIEHRANIINILHTDGFLSSKQMIITTHDRLFWEKFCNSFSTNDIDIRISYVLTKELCGISVKEYKEINHDEKISVAISYYDLRQAILYTRIWFEQIMLNYSKYKGLDVKGKIKGKITVNTSSLYLETTIDLLYSKFYQSIQTENGWDNEKNSAFECLKTNTLNWEVINQEGHAHDEQTRNIIHSITSNEITSIQNNARILNDYIISILNATTPTQPTT